MRYIRVHHNRNEAVIQFLYLLLRDHITLGDMEDILRNHIKRTKEKGWTDFEEPAIVEYVIKVARQLGVDNLIVTQEITEEQFGNDTKRDV